MGRPVTTQGDPLERIDHRAFRALLDRDGRSGSEVLRALKRHTPPVRLSTGSFSRLLTGAQESTRRSIRLALEAELLGWSPSKSVLLGEVPVGQVGRRMTASEVSRFVGELDQPTRKLFAAELRKAGAT